MQWSDIRERHPRQWLLIEALEAHTDGDERVLDDIGVVRPFADWASAWQVYKELHREDPRRELYIAHADRELLEIGELRWVGFRQAS